MGKVIELPQERKRQAHTVYRLEPRRGQTQGDRVPSVTTILQGVGSDALMSWANRQGLDGIDIRRDFRARNIGTIAHKGIEWVLRGGGDEKPDVSEFAPELVEAGRHTFDNWKKWYAEHEVEPLHMEVPLVHQQLAYGGTFDLLANVDGITTLVDWKTKDGDPSPYPSHFVQLSAYAELLRVNDYPQPERLMVVAVSRTQDHPVPFRTEVVPEWSAHFEVFRAALDLYRARRVVGA